MKTDIPIAATDIVGTTDIGTPIGHAATATKVITANPGMLTDLIVVSNLIVASSLSAATSTNRLIR